MRAWAIILFVSALGLKAQHRSAHAELASQEIRLGEQTELIIEAEGSAGPVVWPALNDTLTQRITIVGASAIDTISDRGILRRVIRITSFDTGYWAVPPFRLSIGNRSAETEPLLLHVIGVPLDANGAMRKEKPLIVLPFSPLWWMRQHAAWLVGAAVVLAGALLLFILIKRRKPTEKSTPAEAVLPLHEHVLGLLQELERQRLWQQGEHKSYQSQLTDILRGYIEERFHVPALERTTDDLLQELRVSPMRAEHQAHLGNMLHAADLVKFAKAIPTSAENEQLMAGAVRFVLETRVTDTTAHAQQS